MTAATTPVRVRNKAELKAAFQAWAEQHGYVWFGGDLRLAEALVSYLGMEGYKIDGVGFRTGEGDDTAD